MTCVIMVMKLVEGDWVVKGYLQFDLNYTQNLNPKISWSSIGVTILSVDDTEILRSTVN